MKRPGGQTVLSSEDELKLVQNFDLACKWGFPLTAHDLRGLVKTYLDARGVQKFKKGNWRGRDWVRGFLQRHKGFLSQRWCKNIKRSRAGVNRVSINSYFDEIENSLKDIDPDLIVNYDETNITDDPGKSRVIVRRGMKHAHKTMDSSKSSQSSNVRWKCFWEFITLYIVYKAENLYNTWTLNGPPEARFNRSKSGWFTEALFED